MNRYRWRRFIAEVRAAAQWRTWLSVMAGSSLISALVLVVAAAQSERYRNELISRFALARLDYLANDLLIETRDWAAWDETYRHAKRLSANYYGNGNFNRDTFLRTPMVMVLDRKGKPVSTARWREGSHRIESLSPRAMAALLRVVPQPQTLTPRTFLALYEGSPYLMSAQLVYPSAGDAPPAGRLLFVRPLGSADMESARRTLELERLRFEPVHQLESRPLGPLALAIRPARWEGLKPMQISVLRPATERVNALIAFGLLLALDALLLIWLLISSYRQSRRRRLEVAQQLIQSRRLGRALLRRDSVDPLTGLLNSQGLVAALAQQAQEHPWQEQALLLLDIRRFALINNGLGRETGDRILVAFGRWLQQLLPPSTPIARTSVDVFACALEGASATALRQRIDAIVGGLQQLDLQVDQRTVRLSVSAGARLLADSTPEAALHECALACDLAKLSGARPYQFYGESQETMKRYTSIQKYNQELISAINEDRIALFGQAGWRLSDPGLPPVYLELLSRMHDPVCRTYRWSEALVEAATFCGSMPLLDGHVLRLGFQRINQMLRLNSSNSALSSLVYAINLTPETLLADDFVRTVESLLQLENLDPRRLCFEITEQAAVRNLELLRSVMHQVRNCGIRFSLDDFGTGMTSLSHLNELPLDYVKIDKTFVWQFKGEASSRITVEFIVKLGADLGFEVIAEGVENLSMLEDLRTMGVGIAQGYVTSMPTLFDPQAPSESFSCSGRDQLASRLSPLL